MRTINFKCIFIFFLIPLISFSQDLIVKKDSSKIFCKITKEDSLSIFYKSVKDKQGVELSIKKSDVIKYFNTSAIAKAKESKMDTTDKIYRTKFLKKGIYKSYREFINNCPYYTKEFKVVERNTLLAAGSPYDFNVFDGTDVGAWGFCDGKDIYVQGLRGAGYCKLEYLGRYSFFTFVQHGIGLTAAIIPDHLIIIDDKGEYQDGTVSFVKKFIREKDATLGLEYEKLEDKKEKRREYLIKLNELLKEKK